MGVGHILSPSRSDEQQTAEILKKTSPLPDGTQHRIASEKKKNTVPEVKLLPQVHWRMRWRESEAPKPRNRKTNRQTARQ